MPHLTCSRRDILSATALLTAVGVIPAARHLNNATGSPSILVSVERAGIFGTGPQALVLAGPRIDRLQAMAAALRTMSGEVVLRLDGTDESLLDVAAQQAGVNVIRNNEAADDFGTRARVGPHQRNIA